MDCMSAVAVSQLGRQRFDKYTPDAHSPMPSPSTARQSASCTALRRCRASEQTEDDDRDVERSHAAMRSAITQSQAADAALINVNVPSNPAVASPKPK
jgi:hypothetical protein